MRVFMTCVVGEIVKKASLTATALAIVILAGPAYADVLQGVNRLFELHSKLRPGMTIEALNEILGPPLESRALGGVASAVTRYAWLHGEMGIEAYELDGFTYRVAITWPRGSHQNQLLALDALTRRGQSIYGSMPRADTRRNEFYWVRDGIRFAFSRHNQTNVFSSSTRTH